jgi:hypothetical protein
MPETQRPQAHTLTKPGDMLISGYGVATLCLGVDCLWIPRKHLVSKYYSTRGIRISGRTQLHGVQAEMV